MSKELIKVQPQERSDLTNEISKIREFFKIEDNNFFENSFYAIQTNIVKITDQTLLDLQTSSVEEIKQITEEQIKKIPEDQLNQVKFTTLLTRLREINRHLSLAQYTYRVDNELKVGEKKVKDLFQGFLNLKIIQGESKPDFLDNLDLSLRPILKELIKLNQSNTNQSNTKVESDELYLKRADAFNKKKTDLALKNLDSENKEGNKSGVKLSESSYSDSENKEENKSGVKLSESSDLDLGDLDSDDDDAVDKESESGELKESDSQTLALQTIASDDNGYSEDVTAMPIHSNTDSANENDQEQEKQDTLPSSISQAENLNSVEVDEKRGDGQKVITKSTDNGLEESESVVVALAKRTSSFSSIIKLRPALNNNTTVDSFVVENGDDAEDEEYVYDPQQEKQDTLPSSISQAKNINSVEVDEKRGDGQKVITKSTDNGLEESESGFVALAKRTSSFSSIIKLRPASNNTTEESFVVENEDDAEDEEYVYDPLLARSELVEDEDHDYDETKSFSKPLILNKKDYNILAPVFKNLIMAAGLTPDYINGIIRQGENSEWKDYEIPKEKLIKEDANLGSKPDDINNTITINRLRLSFDELSNTESLSNADKEDVNNVAAKFFKNLSNNKKITTKVILESLYDALNLEIEVGDKECGDGKSVILYSKPYSKLCNEGMDVSELDLDNDGSDVSESDLDGGSDVSESDLDDGGSDVLESGFGGESFVLGSYNYGSNDSLVSTIDDSGSSKPLLELATSSAPLETTAPAVTTSSVETIAPAVTTSSLETTAPAVTTSVETTAPLETTSSVETIAPAVTTSVETTDSTPALIPVKQKDNNLSEESYLDLLFRYIISTDPNTTEGKESLEKLNKNDRIKNFLQSLEHRTSDWRPKGPYVGCGIDCELEQENGLLKINSIFSPELGRFFENKNNNTGERNFFDEQACKNLLEEACINKMTRTTEDGTESIDLESEEFKRLDKGEKMKKLADMMHQFGDISYEITKKDGKKTTVCCQVSNKTIFVTKDCEHANKQDTNLGEGKQFNPKIHGIILSPKQVISDDDARVPYDNEKHSFKSNSAEPLTTIEPKSAENLSSNRSRNKLGR